MDEKLKEVIARFPDGNERFRRSAIFNTVVQVLARGGDEYDVINSLIKNAEKVQKAYTDHLSVCNHRDIIPKV